MNLEDCKNKIFNFVKTLVGSFRWYSNKEKGKEKYAGTLVITSLLTYILVLTFGVKNGDAQYYHLHAIDWIISNPLPFGLTNLKEVLGFNTAWFSLGAVVEQPLFFFNYPIFVINAIILTLYGMLLISIIFRNIQQVQKNSTIAQIILNLKYSEWFFILSLLPVSIFSYGNIASPSPDFPVFLLTLAFFGAIIDYIESEDISQNYLLWMAVIYAFFAAGIKLSAVLLTPFIFLFMCIIFLCGTPPRQWSHKIIQLMQNIPIGCYILAILSVIPACIRGLITSGSPIFPKIIPIVHDMFSWSVPHDIAKSTSQDVLTWARSPGVGHQKSLVGYDWIREWVISFITWQKGLLALLLILSAVIFIYVTYRSMLENKSVKIMPICSIRNVLLMYPFFMIVLGLLFWFFTGPDPRFAAGYLFSFALYMILFPYIRYEDVISPNLLKRSKVGITILFVTMTIAVTGYCFADSFIFDDEMFPKPMQTLAYTPHTIGAEIIYTPDFTDEEVANAIVSRHPLLTAHTFRPNLTITRDSTTEYYRMFQINL